MFFQRDRSVENGETTHRTEAQAILLAEKRLGFVFKRKELLRYALTHRSYAHEAGLASHNERLELLGDAVVGLVVTEALLSRFSKMEEGDLSQLKSFLVSRRLQAKIAKHLGLSECVLLGTSEERTGGRNRSSILAGLLEALVGAIYLDQGLGHVRELLEKTLLPHAIRFTSPGELKDPKTKLQELVQGMGLGQPSYRVIDSKGPDHSPTFTVEVNVGSQRMGRGKGKSKKDAERAAATEALTALESRIQGVDPVQSPPDDTLLSG